MGLPAGDYSPYRQSFRDKGGEIGSFGVYGLPLSAANFTAYIALAQDFQNAVEAITLGVVTQVEYGILTIVNPISNASSPSAQRENKLLVRYHDATTLEKMTATIPTIDLPNLVFETDAKDFVSKTAWGAGGAVMTDFVAAWEDFVVNPRTENLTVIDSLEYVGRNT